MISNATRAPLAVLTTAMLTSWLCAQAPLGAPPAPPQNRVTPAKAVLGKILFWEEQLSSNNRVACGTCHTFAAGGGDLRRSQHPGIDNNFGTAEVVPSSSRPPPVTLGNCCSNDARSRSPE
ncbi:MAG TPA: hypothetical protein EYP98_17045, partial [Planctomycetes bacterium]|nr:hypothetical protein [Planctomycetota bacterium]